jgi:hypothetical protein
MLEVATPQSATAPQQVAQPVAAEHHTTFHEILSALNPLQYLPVIGTIYRTITGDQIPEPLRRIGSFIVSAVIGGPIGAVINVATMAAEKIIGVDLDQTGQDLLSGHRAADDPVANPRLAAALVARADTPVAMVPPPAAAWSPAQLATYGVTTAGDGNLKLAGLSGADVLNSLELSRIQVAHSAYDRALRLAA